MVITQHEGLTAAFYVKERVFREAIKYQGMRAVKSDGDQSNPQHRYRGGVRFLFFFLRFCGIDKQYDNNNVKQRGWYHFINGG